MENKPSQPSKESTIKSVKKALLSDILQIIIPPDVAGVIMLQRM